MLFATGEASDRAVDIGERLHRTDRPRDALAGLRGVAADRHAPPVAVNAQVNEVASANRELRIDAAALRDVPDRGIATMWMAAEDQEVA